MDSCREDIVRTISLSIAEAKDNLVLECIKDAIGFEVCHLENLRGRLSTIHYTQDKKEEWELDGKLLITFYQKPFGIDYPYRNTIDAGFYYRKHNDKLQRDVKQGKG